MKFKLNYNLDRFTAAFHKPPLSVFNTMSGATHLFGVTWYRLLPYGFICALLSLGINMIVTRLLMRVEYRHGFSAMDMIIQILCSLGLIAAMLFLVISVAYRLQQFRDSKPVAIKEVLQKALTKVCPALVAFFIVIFSFAVITGLIGVATVFSLSMLSKYPSLWMTLLEIVIIIVSFLITMRAFVWLFQVSLYTFAIALDNKTIIESIIYSASLINNGATVGGTFLLLICVELIANYATILLPTNLTPYPWAYTVSYLILASFIFPWAITCLVCWYWHLQNHQEEGV